MNELQRPRTVYFNTNAITNLRENEVMESLRATIDIQHVKGIQVTQRECRVTLSSLETKQELKASGINLRNMHVRMQDADKTVLNVTVKDAPVEMSDIAIASVLEVYGSVVQGSIRRGKIRGTDIETGTRYLSMVNVEEQTYLPRTVNIGRFTLRIFCDKNLQQVKKCYRCHSTEHIIRDCPEKDPICSYCGQSGHKQTDCVDHQELELGQDTEQRYEETAVQNMNNAHDERKLATSSSETSNAIVDQVTPSSIETPDTLILGASMIKHIDMSSKAVVIAESGMTASNVGQLLAAARNKVDQDKVKRVVVHLGTNDNSRHKDDADTVKLNMADCIAQIRREYPEAQVCVASIPPRKGKSASVQAYNRQATSINAYLQKSAERSDKLQYLDTTTCLAPSGHPVKRYYSDSDPSGIHLSPSGQDKLKEIFEGYLERDNSAESRKRNRSEVSSTSSTPLDNEHKKGRSTNSSNSITE